MRSIDSCREFRARLERALEGRPLPGELSALSWHAHLLHCESCRTLLEREEALEELLASLPAPKLEPALARRVLARLRESEFARDGLDALLELDPAGAPPAELGARIASAVRRRAAEESERALELLLELDAALPVPPGLAQRTLNACASERVAPREHALDRLLELDARLEAPAGLAGRVRLRLAAERSRRRRVAGALSAAAALTLIALPLWWAQPSAPKPHGLVEAPPEPAPDSELLAFLAQGGLELLADPLLWVSHEDLEIALAVSLDTRYEAVLEVEAPPVADAPPGSTRTEGGRLDR